MFSHSPVGGDQGQSSISISLAAIVSDRLHTVVSSLHICSVCCQDWLPGTVNIPDWKL